MEEYYLLYYHSWLPDDEGGATPSLTYCVSIGKLPYSLMEGIADRYGINYHDDTGYWVFFPGFLADGHFDILPDGRLHGLPGNDAYTPFNLCYGAFYEIRPRRFLTETLKVICGAAMVDFKRVAGSGCTDEAIRRMQTISQAVVEIKMQTKTEERKVTTPSRNRDDLNGVRMEAVLYAIKHPTIPKRLIEQKFDLAERTFSRKSPNEEKSWKELIDEARASTKRSKSKSSNNRGGGSHLGKKEKGIKPNLEDIPDNRPSHEEEVDNRLDGIS
jgi:hypothetical protein